MGAVRRLRGVLAVCACLVAPDAAAGLGEGPRAAVPALGPTGAPRPRCRTFYAHGEAAGKDGDGVEYSALLVWAEHAARLEGSPPGTEARRLAVNVTATEGGRVMLGAAARALPGQARYELVLAARAGGCRLADQNARVNATPAASANASLALFDDGELQVWLTWTTTAAADNGTLRAGLLEVTVMPAGASAATLLFSYRTDKPIQLDTFSFGTTNKGDAGFTVCSVGDAVRSGGTAPSGLGVAGCRSLLVHVHSSHAGVHNLGLAWPDTADRHGRLQFWARASTDVEVDVGERVKAAGSEHSYHAVLGGDFNSRSWAVFQRQRCAVVDTPALLSDFQFRPLWVAVSPSGTLSAGEGEVADEHHHHHPGAVAARELFSWRHPRRPEPKFVSFQTFRQRLVHILIDCDRSPSPTQPPAQPYPDDLLGAARRSMSTPSGRLRTPAVRLNLTSLTLHNGTGVVTGFLILEWQHFKDSEWNPLWFDNVEKIQFWPKSEAGDANGVSISALSSNQSQSGVASLDSGTLEVNTNKQIFQNIPLSLKLPCEENLIKVSCSIQLNFTILSDVSHFMVSSHLQHKWFANWRIISQNQRDNYIIFLKLTSNYHNHSDASNLGGPLAQQKKSNGWLNFIAVILTVAALITIIFRNKSLARNENSVGYSVWFRIKQKLDSKERHNTLLDGTEQETADIVGFGSQQFCSESKVKKQNSIPFTQQRWQEQSFSRLLRFPNLDQVQLAIIFLTASLLTSVLDLILRVKFE